MLMCNYLGVVLLKVFIFIFLFLFHILKHKYLGIMHENRAVEQRDDVSPILAIIAAETPVCST